MAELMSSREKLERVRGLLIEYCVDAFLVYSGDAHKSEYVADYDKRRAFLTEFTGSAGTALVTADKALLWTDGRYFNQASSELSGEWTLMRSGERGVPEIGSWMVDNMSENQVVAVDSNYITAKEAKTLNDQLAERGIVFTALTPSSPNPVDVIWDLPSNNRPSPPHSIATIHPLECAGVSHSEKIRHLQQTMSEKKIDVMIISALDEIAWLFNLRGSDISFNPVLISYAILAVSPGCNDDPKIDAYLFIDPSKTPVSVVSHLSSTGDEAVEFHLFPYAEVSSQLSQIICEASHGSKKVTKTRVMLDSASLNWRLHQEVEVAKGAVVVDMPSLVALAKACKNPSEVNGLRESHVRDGVALTAFLAWLEGVMTGGESSRAVITEHEAAVKLESYRAAMPGYVSPSFATISSYGANGAVVHYRPPVVGSAELGRDSLYLLDSGAQFQDGTTDVTRTLYFGPSELDFPSSGEGAAAARKLREMKSAYTHVLKGHIALATAKFPEGTLGYRLDSIARAPLWAAGMDYGHGTGHGVGAFLNVHEGPHGISTRPRYGDTGFKEGMTTSNEPGYYKDGDYGIRIENICIAQAVPETSLEFTSSMKYLTFETVTMCPLERRLMNLDLLNKSEIRWVNEYHEEVRRKLLDPMQGLFPGAVPYLMAKTEPL